MNYLSRLFFLCRLLYLILNEIIIYSNVYYTFFFFFILFLSSQTAHASELPPSPHVWES